ncbi:hypothetical protein GCM10009863_21230 [Streptomyces axinellae]|uniref:4-hydroxythreonine-4-phosphate dehydrogenase n=1 Tax=Streptomyces axinellae TaxID=552788 RepID=A0ABP6CBK0_9ACTN
MAALLRLPARLELDPARARQPPDTPDALAEWASGSVRTAVVTDLDSRQADPESAAEAVRALLAGSGPDAFPPRGIPYAEGGTGVAPAQATTATGREPLLWYKKADSLLRGNVGAEAAAFAEGAEAVVTAMALPGTGRVVREGVVHVQGVPLHESGAWRAEGRTAPRSLPEALAPLPTVCLPVGAVRRGARALAGRLKDAAAQGLHPVCDAETDADLTVIAEAALSLGPGYRLLGSGGLAAALGRIIGDGTAHDAPTERIHAAARPLLVVVGSAEPVIRTQIAHLVAAGAHHVTLTPRSLVNADADLSPNTREHAHAQGHSPAPARTVFHSGADSDPGSAPAHAPLPSLAPHAVTVLSIDGADGIRPAQARHLVCGLARTVAALPGGPDLVLTGGETARRVLDALGITTLRPVGEIHHGAVHCRTPEGRSVVTRPGSFGGPDSLLRIATALRPHLLCPPAAPEPSPPKPPTAPPRQGVTQ